METLAGIKTLELEIEDGKAVSVTVDMGEAASHPGCRRISYTISPQAALSASRHVSRAKNS